MDTWRYIKEDKVSADYGLATDEFLMNAYSNPSEPNPEMDSKEQLVPTNENATLRLYTYRDYCTLVGRFQNIHAELDLDNIKKTGCQFSRRLTGGGAIIMGQGQLGLCLATANTFGSENTRTLYHLFSAPVLAALKDFGIEAKFRGKNDLEVAGKKIAGLGIHVNPFGAIQFHTSLLVDLDISVMLNVLNIPLQKIGDKSKIHKVEQRITTISKELNRQVTVEEVRELVKFYFEKQFKIKFQEKALTKKEQNEIEKLAKEKYRNEDWLFQNSPQADMTGMGLKKTPAGLLRTYVALKGEIIKSVLITGDFIEQEKLFKYIEAQLKWSALDKEQILKVIQKAFLKFSESTVGLSERAVFHSIWTAAMAAMKEVQYTYEGSCYYPDSSS